MCPVTVTVGPLAAANAALLRAAAAIGGAGALALLTNTLDKPRRIIFTSSGNDTGITFTIIGTDAAGSTITEVVTGASGGAASSVLDYKTVTSITASGAAAGTVSIGTNSVAASPWVRMDEWALPQIAIQCTVSGTVNATVQSTLDDPNDNLSNPTTPSTGPTAAPVITPANMTWVATNDAAAVGFIATVQTNYGFCPKFIRVLLNSGTGSVTTTITQSGVNPI